MVRGESGEVSVSVTGEVLNPLVIGHVFVQSSHNKILSLLVVSPSLHVPCETKINELRSRESIISPHFFLFIF